MIDTEKISPEMTREEMESLFGEPTHIGRGSRKYPTPCVYRYGRIEIAFGPKKEDGIFYVIDVGESGAEHDYIFQQGIKCPKTKTTTQ